MFTDEYTEKLEVDNAKLRAALEKIAGTRSPGGHVINGHDAQAIARAVLADCN